MLHPLVVKLIACFQHRSYSCFLYAGSTLVGVFGQAIAARANEAHHASIREMLAAFTERVCTDGGVLATAEHFVNLPDVVGEPADSSHPSTCPRRSHL